MSAVTDSLIISLKAAPANWQFRLGLIEALVAEGRTDEAHAVISEVKELPADDVSKVLAAQAYGIFDPNIGIEVLDGLIVTTPTYAPAYLAKSKLLLKLGDSQYAATQYTMATTLDAGLADSKLAKAFGGPAPATPTPVEVPAEATPEVLPAPATAVPVDATPEVLPAPANAAPVDATPEVPQLPQVAEQQDLYYPQPGHYPTMPLSEAMGVAPVQLVDPNSVPQHPELAYQTVQHVDTVHTPQEQFLDQVNNVEVHSAHFQDAVTYDYQDPNEAIFAPTVTEDEIYVGATVTESGEPVANLYETIRAREEEKKRQNKAAATRDKFVSLTIALITIVVACLLMLTVVSKIPRPKAPALVASSVAFEKPSDIVTETIQKQQLNQTPAAPTVSMDVVTSHSSSNFAMSNFDLPSSDFGAVAATSFESSMSFGSTSNEPVSFFGSTAASNKVVFVVDASLSMKATGSGGKVTKVDLMKKELIKTVGLLPEGVDFQILFFSGPSWFLDLTPLKNDPNPQIAIQKYNQQLVRQVKKDWAGQGAHDWEFKGGQPSDWPDQKYIRSTPSNRRLAIEMIKGTPLMLGTDWRDPLKMAMKMKPDTIYFMTDGAVAKHPTKKPVVDDVLDFNRKNSKATINTVCMMVLKASEQLQELASKTKGEFVLVKEDGTSVTGSELKRLIRKKK